MEIRNTNFLQPYICDSGAHSVEMGTWDRLPLAEYAEFSIEYSKKFRNMIVPDDIGNSEETHKNTVEYINRVRDHLDITKIVPVYHVQCVPNDRGLLNLRRVIDYSIECGFEWICLGGALGSARFKTEQELRIALHLCVDLIRKLAPEKKIHCLGVIKPILIQGLKPDAIDSAVYIQYSSTMMRMHFDDKFTKILKTGLKGKDRETITRYVGDILYDKLCYIKDGNRTLKDKFNVVSKDSLISELLIQPESLSLNMLNQVAVIEFENYMRTKYNYDFTYVTTIPPTCGYEGFFFEMAKHFAEYRTLVSFSQFFDIKTGRFTNQRILNFVDNSSTNVMNTYKSYLTR